MINIDALNDDEKLAALESIHKSIAESKEIQKKKITTNVEMILKALKKIEGDLKQRYDETGNLIANLKNGTDGRDGKEGRDGKDGRAGKDGAMGPRGYDGLPGRNGLDGEDGVSITDAHIDFDGSLIISLSTGRVINVGEVVTADIAERIKVITNGGGTSQYVLDTLASLQSQISAISSGLEYQGTWNASTNVPTLTSSVGTAGYYYIVATAGSTNLNGITDWQIGDWAVFNGTVWQKLDQTNLVTSVAGRTGAIVLTTADIGGLGTIATQASSNVSITGGSITGITDLAIADGGTGQSTAAAAITALTGTQTSGYYLRSNGTNSVLAAIVAADVPTLNQNTTGTAANVTGTVAIANGGTGQTTANTAFNALAPSQTSNSGKYLTTDGTNTSWATNASGTVTSVAASVPTFLSVSGSPITTSGTLAITLSGTALPTANGGTGLTSFTLNSVPYATSTSVLTSDSALMFNGSSLSITASNSGFLGLITQNTSAGVTATSGSGYLNNISAGSYLFTYGSNNTLSVFGITAGDYTGILSDGASSNGILFGSLTNKPIVFGVNNAEQMRLTTTGLGIGTTAGSKLDVKGTLRLSGSTSGYVGLAPAAAAGSTTYTLPSADGTANQALVTNGSGTLSWASTTTGTVTSVAASVPTFLSITGSPITTSGTLAITLSGTALPTTSGGTGLTSFTSGGVVYASSSSALATGTGLLFDGFNIGVNITPNTWLSTFRAIQLGQGASIWGALTGNNAAFDSNAYVNTAGSSIYIGSTFATRYQQSSGEHLWKIAASGTAGNAITFTQAMTLDASGRLGIGTTSPASPLVVRTFGATGRAAEFNGDNILMDGAGQFDLLMGDGGVAYMSLTTTDNATALKIRNYTGNVDIATFERTTGNVGIGTTSPGRKLEVQGSAGYLSTFRNNSATATTSYINVINVNNSSNGLVMAHIDDGTGYIGTQNNAALRFVTNDTERARIDSSGNLGINTSSPGQKLDVNGSIRSRDGAFIASIGTATKGLFSTYNQIFGSGTDYTPVIFAETGLGMTFAVNGSSTKAVSIDTSGNLLVGTTSTYGSAKMSLGFVGSANNGFVINNTNSSGSPVHIAFQLSGTSVGDITCSGASTAYNTSSDYRLKENIAPMTGALAKVALLKPCTYKWNVDGSDGQGFIAHELAEVVPQCVTGEKDAIDEDGKPQYQGIDTSFLVATLTAALQEQQTIINSLKARLDAANL